MPGQPLSEAWAELHLSTSTWDADLRAAQKRLIAISKQIEATSKVEVTASINTTRTKAQIEAELKKLGTAGVVIPMSLDAKAAEATAAELVAGIENANPTFTVDANTAPAEAKAADLQRSFSAFEDVIVQVEVRDQQIAEAEESLLRLLTLAGSVDNEDITIDATLRDAGIRAELGELSALIATITGEPANIQLDLDGATLTLEKLAEIQAQVAVLDGRRIDLHARFDSANAVAEIEAVDAAAAKTADPKRGGLGRMATVMAFMGIGGVVAIGAAGAAITTFGVKSAAQLEATQKAFENILGSAEKADALFKELQAFAIPSPFDTQVLADTAKQLLAIGVSVEEVIPTVKDLGAIVALLAGGSNEAFGRLTLALGQIRSAVKPLTQDLRQITSAIPGFNTEMQLAQGVAEKFGITVREAQEKIKDGGITGADAFDIILQRMRDFPGVAGAIAAAADTLGGKLSAFKDTIKVNLVGAFSGVTKQIEDLLGPLQTAVEKVLPTIASSIARSLERIIPQVPKLVESLGTGLAPAFEGIFTGLAGAIEGITPIIERVLPVLGEIGPIVGDILAKLGPVVADTGENLAGVLVPALQSLADVLNIIPTDVLSGLVTAFLAFKAVSAISGVVGPINTALTEFGNKRAGIDGVTTSIVRLQDAAKLAGPAIGGFFAGMAGASEDASTRAVAAIGAIGAIGTGLAQGGLPGGAVATLGVTLGLIVGKFQEGKREAEAFDKAVQALAHTLETAFPDAKNLDIAGALDSDQVRQAIDNLVGQKGLTNSLLQAGVGLDTLVTHLGDSRDDFNAWVATLAQSKLAAAGFNDVAVKISGNKITIDNSDLSQTADVVAQAQTALNKFSPELSGVLDIYNQTNAAVQEFNTHQAFATEQWQAASFAANEFERRAAGVGAVMDVAAAATAREALATAKWVAELQKFNVEGVNGPIEAANLFEARLAALGDAEDAHAKHMKDLADAFTAQFDKAKTAVDGLNESLRELQGLLSSDLARQNFAADLKNFADSINQVTNQDQIDKGLQLQDKVAAQRQAILDQQQRIIDAQQKADVEAGTLQDEIQFAQSRGAVNRARALQNQLDHVNDDTNRERDKLQAQVNELRDLESQLSKINLTPQHLLDQVKAQAATSGLSLADFLKSGTTPEALQANQQIITPLVDDALSQIQTELETKGVDAAQVLAKQLEAGLLATFTPQLGQDAAQQIVDTYLPDDKWFQAGQKAAEEAKKAAVAEFLATGSIPMSLKLDADTQQLIDTIKLIQKEGLPPQVQQVLAQFQAGTISPDQLERLSQQFTDQNLLPVGVSLDDVINAIDEIKRLPAQTLVNLGINPDKLLSDIQQIQPNVDVSVVPDVTPLQQALNEIASKPLVITVIPTTAPTEVDLQERRDLANTRPGRIFRWGGIMEMGSHWAGREMTVPFARYGEPATHGEAVFVPMHGDRARSERLLRYVADRMSMDLSPRDRGPRAAVSVPTAARDDVPNVATIERLLRSVAREAGTRRTTQQDFERNVIVERIEKLVIGEGATPRKRASEFVTEMRMRAARL